MPEITAESYYTISSFLRNPVFLSAIFSMFFAQFIKAIIMLIRHKTRSFREVILTLMWKTGGMPSSHSALAVAVSTAIGFTNGIGSNIFILSLFFMLVVIRDAVGVRRATGVQAKTINTLGNGLFEKFGISFHPVKEVHGHTIPEVIAGASLGFFIALAFCTL